MKMNNAP
jgi:hypothetical protein